MLPDFVRHFKGKKPGPTVVVMGTIHGNERVGAFVVDMLAEEMPDLNFTGEIYLIIGNPKAYAHNVRYMDSDLNRLFGPDYDELKKIPVDERNYEQSRALELGPILESADFLLDLHSTIRPSVPFCYCEYNELHLDLAFCMEPKYVVSPEIRLPDLISSTDNMVDRHGGIGITFESGWHQDDHADHKVLEKVKIFLQKVGMYDFAVRPICEGQPHLAIYEQVICETDDFHFDNPDVSNFDFLKEGFVLAYDGGEEVRVKKDSYLVFPKTALNKGNIACYLAYQK